jgi:hypothetical protein
MAADRLKPTFAALADPTRRAILGRLAMGESSVTQLAKPFVREPHAIDGGNQALDRFEKLRCPPPAPDDLSDKMVVREN